MMYKLIQSRSAFPLGPGSKVVYYFMGMNSVPFGMQNGIHNIQAALLKRYIYRCGSWQCFSIDFTKTPLSCGFIRQLHEAVACCTPTEEQHREGISVQCCIQRMDF